jgi:Flp pilus assembly protein TadD
MTRHSIFLSAMVVVPAVVAVWWWYYGPTYQQSHLLADAEKAVQAEDFAKAEELLRQILKDNPNQPRPQLLYAKTLRRLGRRKEADLPLLRAIELGVPELETRREYALLEARDDFTLAERSLLIILDSNPDDLEVVQTLAVCYARQGRWPEAQKWYTRWLEIEPGRQEALFDRGRVRLQAGAYGPAITDFREVLKASPNHFQARLLLAHCLLSEAKISEAEAELQTCRKLRPASPEPLTGLATCAMENNDLDRAQQLVHDALTLEPNFPLALHLQGNLYLRQKKSELAIPVFEKIVAKNKDDKEGHLKLAQALSQSGQTERAKKHQQIFQQLDREDQLRQQKERGIRPPGTK